MFWLVALFIILQPGIFSTKKTFVKVEDILLRALIFGIVMYFLGGSKEGFQDSNTTCNPPDGYMKTSIPGANDNILCLKPNLDISVRPTIGDGNTITTLLYYNDSQRITIQDQTAYYTAPLMTKAQWNPEFMPLQIAFPYETHNAILMGVSNKLDFIERILDRTPEDKWDAVSSFYNSFIYEMPSTGASLTLIPLTAAAAPPLPIKPIPAEWLSNMRAAKIRQEAGYGTQRPTGPPPEGAGGPLVAGSEALPPAAPPPPPPPSCFQPLDAHGRPLPPPGYIQGFFMDPDNINAVFDSIDRSLNKISNDIKNFVRPLNAP
jgi:hypothetical protein